MIMLLIKNVSVTVFGKQLTHINFCPIFKIRSELKFFFLTDRTALFTPTIQIGILITFSAVIHTADFCVFLSSAE